MKQRRDRIRVLIPLLVLMVGMALTMWLWRSLVNHENIELHRTTAQEAAAVRNAIVERMRWRTEALVRLAKRVEFLGQANSGLWHMNAALLAQQMPGTLSVEWADSRMRVQLVWPAEGIEHRLGSSLESKPLEAEAFERARDQKTPVIIQTDDEPLTLSRYVPAFANGTFLGEVIQVSRTTDTFDAILNALEAEETALRGYSFGIYADGGEVYSHIRGSRKWEKRWGQSVPFGIQEAQWMLKVWPSESLHAQLRSPLPETALAGGAATSLLLALAVHMALLARWYARHHEEANALLREEIHERHRAEKSLREVAGQLERSNRELQDFASVASHDLQEPLRKIQAFGDRLSAKYAAQLSEEGQDYLRRMHTAAGRMRRLIEDLLTYSRVTTRALPFEEVDLSAIAAEVLDDLETRIEQTHARIEIDSLPILQADPSQMRQLFQNLLGNGLKFQKPAVPPHVQVSGGIVQVPAEDQKSIPMCRISFQDNGIGFDERYLDRIFTVFQRLHSRTEYAGTGVGLAICRKIAQRHGGSITARSAPGQGAEFIVLLPLKQPESQEEDHGPETDNARQADHDSPGG